MFFENWRSHIQSFFRVVAMLFQSAPKPPSYAQMDAKVRKVRPKWPRNTVKVTPKGFTKSLKSIGKMCFFGKLSALEAPICIIRTQWSQSGPKVTEKWCSSDPKVTRSKFHVLKVFPTKGESFTWKRNDSYHQQRYLRSTPTTTKAFT